MRSGSYQQSSYAQRTSPRRRAVALLAAIAADVLLILLLLRLSPAFSPPPAKPDISTFRLLPEALNSSADATKAKAKRAGGAAARKPSARPAASAAHPPLPTTMPLNMVTLSRDDYSASDISKLPSHSEDHAQSADANGTGTGPDSGAGDGKGAGPNGERLYDADWYRRPTHAELATYLPADAPSTGWGMIACQTVERYHVDNCRELGDSPAGSGLARAVREAAWQFLVMPPRINGRPLIGSWVRIRIEYTATAIR